MWDKAVVDDFRQQFHDNYRKCGVVQSRIAAELGLNDKSFIKWLKKTASWSWIEREKYGQLVERAAQLGIIKDGKQLTSRLESLGITSFFGQDDRDLDTLAANAQGHYAVYRFSRFKPGFVLKGALQIKWDATERALSTHERYRAVVDGKSERWPRTGYLSARSDGRLSILSRKDAINEPQIMYLNRPMVANAAPKPKAFSNTDGVLIDWQGDSCYAARVVIVRVQAALTPKEITDCKVEDVDKAIIERLSRPITITPPKSKGDAPYHVMCIFD